MNKFIPMVKNVKISILIGVMVLGTSYQTLAESFTTYYPTGEIEQVREYKDGKRVTTTDYDKTGRVKILLEYVNSRQSKITLYYASGTVKGVGEVTNGKVS
ncbi:hypothetical protein, partial [Candidatus Thioglobus sp.]|uniref:hypothetical protein n=1 Tax=Candidatus Thioglobus sp. TaxID=2026721 RepID=UPI0026241F86